VLGSGIELDADLRDRIPLHVAHDKFYGTEARPVSDGRSAVEPACQKLGEGQRAFGLRCRIV
jgi:hypothetical protein